MKIVGVSGKDRSGKDTVAEVLMANGYFGYSFGDAVREHAKKRHANEVDPISVKNMTETSNWLRAEFGADVILKEALEAYQKELDAGKSYEGVVLYSVRAPIEADFILEHGGDMVWVETSDEIRYKRRMDNMRSSEVPITIQEMLAQESLQQQPQPGIPVEVQMNLEYVKSKATKVIQNEGNNRDEFIASVKLALL